MYFVDRLFYLPRKIKTGSENGPVLDFVLLIRSLSAQNLGSTSCPVLEFELPLVSLRLIFLIRPVFET